MDASSFGQIGEFLLGLGRVQTARLVLETGMNLPNAGAEYAGNLAESLRRNLQIGVRCNRPLIGPPIAVPEVLRLYLRAFEGGIGHAAPWLLENAAGFATQHWADALKMKWHRELLAMKPPLVPVWTGTILGAVVAGNADAASFGIDAMQRSNPRDPQTPALIAVAQHGVTPDTLDALDDEALQFLLRTYQETGLVEGVVLVSIALLNRDPGNPDYLEAYGSMIESALTGGPTAPELGNYHPTAAGRALLDLSSSLAEDPDGSWLRRKLFAEMKGGRSPEYLLAGLQEHGVDFASVPDSYLFTIGEALLFRSQQFWPAVQILEFLTTRDSHIDPRPHQVHAFVALMRGERWQGLSDILQARRFGQGSGPLRDAKRIHDIHFPQAPMFGPGIPDAVAESVPAAWELLLTGDAEAARKAATDAIGKGDLPPAAEFELRLIVSESAFPSARVTPALMKNMGRMFTLFGDVRQSATRSRGFYGADRLSRAMAARAMEAAEKGRSASTALFFAQRHKLHALAHAFSGAKQIGAQMATEYAKALLEAFELAEPEVAPPHLFTSLAEIVVDGESPVDFGAPWHPLIDELLATQRQQPAASPAPAVFPEKPVALADLQANLRPNDVFLEYLIEPDCVFAVVVRKSEAEVIRIPLDEPLGPVARFAWACAAQPPAALVGWSVEDDCWPLQQLYAVLVGPLLQWLDGAERLIVAPSGPLHRIPFGILHDGDRFLIQKWEVVQVPTAAIFADLTINRGPFALESLAITDTDGTWGEAATGGIRLAQICPRSQHFDQMSIPADRILSLCGSAAFVHLGARGFIDPDFPLCSPVFLGRALTEPMAILQPFAMMKSRANPVLLVVDGMASEASREGTDSELAHPGTAFHAFGATNVIATAWRSEPDAIGGLFSDFYDELVEQPVARALAVTQRRMLAEPPTSHPYFWGAPMLSGEGNAYISGLREHGII